MKRSLAISILLILGASNIATAQNNPPPNAAQVKKEGEVSKKDPIKDPGARKLSRRERKERRAALAEKYQSFLIEVEPIMNPRELDAFLLLESDPQRDRYVEDFWIRRDPDPRSSQNEYREQYRELLAEAKARYKSTSNDAARIMLIKGRPDEVVAINCDRLVQPIELWRYERIPQTRKELRLIFYKPRNGAAFKLFVPDGSLTNLAELLSHTGLEHGPDEVFYGTQSAARGGRIRWECRAGDQLAETLAWNQMNKFEVGQVWEPPKIDAEDVGRFLRASVIATPGATPLKADFSTAFPGKRGSRTSTEMTIMLSRAELKAKELEGSSFYNIDVVGEILKDGKLFENYRYRYDFPLNTTSDQIPIVIERFLRPADYTSRVKVSDANSGAEVIIEKTLSVPEVERPPVTAEEGVAAAEVSATLERLQEDFRKGESKLRIVPLGNDMVTGLQKIETLVTGDAIQAVEFYVDRKKIMIKRTPPFSLELDFGNIPQQHRVRAVGLNDKRQVVTGDEIIINSGTDPFRVHIVSPRVTSNVTGKVRVEIDESIPEGRELESIELYLNDTKLATLYDPPFVQTIEVPATAGIGYIRAVAKLKDDPGLPAEDVVFINSPDYVEEIEVHLIELPVTVIRDGRVVQGLTRNDFRVTDEGKPTEVTKFEYVRNLPLAIGLAIDTSASMRERIAEAQKAGAEFFKNVLRPGDKGFVIAFDDEAQMVQKWTNRLTDLNGGLAALRAEGSTSLYDAVVLSLYSFLGVKGQRALVIISDGEDSNSNFTYEQTLEYAKRTGVPIYVIGIGVSGTKADVKMKLGRLANETGGAVHYIDEARELGRIYGTIQDELRSQYILGISPPGDVKPGSKWRDVEVAVKGAKVKTIRGYYP
jgi:VWFA-related protein